VCKLPGTLCSVPTHVRRCLDHRRIALSLVHTQDIWDSEQARAVGAFAPLPFEDAEVSEVVSTPVKLIQDDGEPASRHQPRAAARRLGAHTEKVLLEEVGLTAEQYASLKALGGAIARHTLFIYSS
jgi:crotonobetainyl-CoA:carnitine CoA-transferase CaiB-like acyl-CoA transferase